MQKKIKKVPVGKSKINDDDEENADWMNVIKGGKKGGSIGKVEHAGSEQKKLKKSKREREADEKRKQ